MEPLYAALAVVAPAAIMFFLVGVLPDMLDNHRELKLRELEVRAKEAEARIRQAERKELDH